MDAAAASVDIDWPLNVAQINTAATGRNLRFAVALPELDAAAASLDRGILPRRLNLHAAAASFCDYLAVGVMNLNRPTASAQPDISGDSPYLDRSAAGLGTYASAYVVQTHSAAAARRVDFPSYAHGVDATAVGLKFHPGHFARNVDRKLAGKMTWWLALPVPRDPGGISFDPGTDFEVFELPAGILLGGGLGTCMNHVINGLLLPASQNDRSRIDFDPQVLHRGQRACDFLAPGAAIAGYV